MTASPEGREIDGGLPEGAELCPCCGSLPCDQVHKPTSLIAAAPELYEALERLLADLERAEVILPGNDDPDPTVQLAVHALARARGEQP